LDCAQALNPKKEITIDAKTEILILFFMTFSLISLQSIYKEKNRRKVQIFAGILFFNYSE
jgi:hypothetical protein